MLPLLLATLAHPAELPLFAWVTDPLQARYYKRLEGEGPVYPRWRRRWSPIRAWTFPDGVAQRVQTSQGRDLVEERRFTSTGEPLTTVRYAEGAPAEVVVHSWQQEASYSLEEWTSHTLHRVTLLAPGEPESPEESTLRWTLPQGELAASVVSGPADVFSEAFLQDGLLQTCGCLAEGRGTTWVDGRVGARYRLRLVGTDRVGEVWAVPLDAAVFLASWTPATREHLALGRAVLALVRW